MEAARALWPTPLREGHHAEEQRIRWRAEVPRSPARESAGTASKQQRRAASADGLRILVSTGIENLKHNPLSDDPLAFLCLEVPAAFSRRAQRGRYSNQHIGDA